MQEGDSALPTGVQAVGVAFAVLAELANTSEAVGTSMERDGLILRERDQSDQRRTLVMATSKGLTMLERLTQVIASHYRGLEESVGSHNLAKLHELLDQLIAHEQAEYIDRLPGEAVRAIVGRV